MPDAAVAKDRQFTFDCDEAVHCIKFSHLEFLTDLLAVGTTIRLTVARCVAKEDKNAVTGMEFDQLAEFHHGTRVVDVCWSLSTDLHSIPRCLALFTAGSDRQIRFLQSDLKADTVITVVGEHKDHVNAVASSPTNGDQVVSVSDDHTCCIWTASEPLQSVACFALTSPGMAVCWHTKSTGKIMVAEKKGVIRMYSTITLQPFMSLDCGHSLLVSADWSLTNELRVAALAGTDWFIFDTSRSSWPLESKEAHAEAGQLVSWSRSHDHMLATTGRPGCQLKVFNIRTNQAVLSVELKMVSGLCWHSRLPLVAVASDRRVLLFVADSVSLLHCSVTLLTLYFSDRQTDT